MKLLDQLLSPFSYLLRWIIASYHHLFSRRAQNLSQIHQWFILIDKRYGVKYGGVLMIAITNSMSLAFGIYNHGYPSAAIFIIQLAIFIKSLSKKAGMSYDLCSASRFLPEITVIYVRVWGYLCLILPSCLNLWIHYNSNMSMEYILAIILMIYLASFASRHTLYHVLHNVIKKRDSIRNKTKWDTVAKLVVFRRFYFNPVIQIRNWMLVLIIVFLIVNYSVFNYPPLIEYYIRINSPVLHYWHLFFRDPLNISITIIVTVITAEFMMWSLRIIRDIFLKRIQGKFRRKRLF